MNPLMRLLAGIVGALALLGALFFGVFIFIFIVCAGLIAWLVMWARMWWIRRQLAARGFTPDYGERGTQHRSESESREAGEVIDAEYEVVSRKEDD